MTITEMLVQEFDQEAASTRKVLERVPDAQFGWRPHPKSMTVHELAAHVAALPSWGVATLTGDDYDFANSEPMYERAKAAASTPELLSVFDEGVTAMRAALATLTPEGYFTPWTLRNNDQVYFSMPRLPVLRGFVLNHGIHHRAQLEVYLRLLDIPLPGVYGPSADEPQMG